MELTSVFCLLLFVHVVLYHSFNVVEAQVEPDDTDKQKEPRFEELNSERTGAKHPVNKVDRGTSGTSLEKAVNKERSLGNYEKKPEASSRKLRVLIKQSERKSVSKIDQSYRSLQISYDKLHSEMSNKYLQLNTSASDIKEQVKSLPKTKSKIQTELLSLENTLNLTVKEIRANLTQLNSDISAIYNWIDTRIQPLEKQLDELKKAQKMTDEKVSSLDRALQQYKGQVNSEIEKLKSDTEKKDELFKKGLELHNDDLKMLNTTQNQTEVKVGKLETGLQQTEKNVKSELEQYQSETRNNSHEFDERLTVQSEKLEEMQKTQSRLEDELRNLRKKFEDSEELQNHKIRQTYTRTVEIESDVRSSQDIFEKVAYIMAGFIGLIGVYVLLYKRPTFGQTRGNSEQKVVVLTPQAQDNDQTEPEDPAPSVNGEVAAPRQETQEPLCPAVCILGFSDSAVATFKRPTLALCPEGVTVHTHVVHGTPDIADTPRDALALVFVDFNERNVILEEPGLLQGELRTKTVQHLLKTGADVFVIYTGDRESQILPAGDLYNTSLTSIHKHALLKLLCTRQRVLSLRSTFSKTQEQVLSEAVDKICQT